MKRERASELKRLWRTNDFKRIQGEITVRASNGKGHYFCPCSPATASALRKDGYRILRLPPFALILW